MVHEIQPEGCLPCQNGTTKTLQTFCRCKGTDAPPAEPVPPPPGAPPASCGGNEAAPSSEIQGVQPGYVYIHTPLPNAQSFNLDAYAKYRKCDKDYIPDLLTDEGTSAG